MYNKDIKLGSLNGYQYFYDPEHPLANTAGIVYYHRHIISLQRGKWLSSNEHIHHIDGDRANNAIENLVVLTNREHCQVHTNTYRVTRICKQCGAEFTVLSSEKKKYCSSRCAAASRRLFEITSDQLRELVWKYPTTQVAKMFSVSDTAIAKRCKLLDVKKPPRGYWAKKRAGH